MDTKIQNCSFYGPNYQTVNLNGETYKPIRELLIVIVVTILPYTHTHTPCSCWRLEETYALNPLGYIIFYYYTFSG